MNKLHESNQIHFFTNNQDVTPTPVIMGSLLQSLGRFGLLPSYAHEINALTGEKKQFITMATTDGNLRIEFPSGAMIISSSNISSTQFLDTSIAILNILKDIFPDKKSNRLSFLSNSLYGGTSEQYKALYDAIFTYRQAEPFEWDNRVVERKNINNETLNCISNIRRCEIEAPFINSGQSTDCIFFELDVNTIPQKNDYRFDLETCNTVLRDIFEQVELAKNSLERYVLI
jgi:hypothetical protein